jgi:hypothetical protein
MGAGAQGGAGPAVGAWYVEASSVQRPATATGDRDRRPRPATGEATGEATGDRRGDRVK